MRQERPLLCDRSYYGLGERSSIHEPERSFDSLAPRISFPRNGLEQARPHVVWPIAMAAQFLSLSLAAVISVCWLLVPPLALPASAPSSQGDQDRRWLLVFPPASPATTDASTRFSGWIPSQFFDDEQSCFRGRVRIYDTSVGTVQALTGACIPAAEFISAKEAHVVIVLTQFSLVAQGFSSHLVTGRVFNRGAATARDVVVKYRIRAANGLIILQGDCSTDPDNNIPTLAFAEFRTPTIGGRSLEGLSIETEVGWLKK